MNMNDKSDSKFELDEKKRKEQKKTTIELKNLDETTCSHKKRSLTHRQRENLYS